MGLQKGLRIKGTGYFDLGLLQPPSLIPQRVTGGWFHRRNHKKVFILKFWGQLNTSEIPSLLKCRYRVFDID